MPVLLRLSAALPRDWSFVQAVSRSNHQGYLTTAMDEIARDMHDIETYFRNLGGKTGRLVFMGVSKDMCHNDVELILRILTLVALGCNDVLRFIDIYGEGTTTDSAFFFLRPAAAKICCVFLLGRN
jgi:hypothetical protein